MNLKLTEVVADIVGMTGLAIIDAILRFLTASETKKIGGIAPLPLQESEDTIDSRVAFEQ